MNLCVMEIIIKEKIIIVIIMMIIQEHMDEFKVVDQIVNININE